jgi:hypothetical protein
VDYGLYGMSRCEPQSMRLPEVVRTIGRNVGLAVRTGALDVMRHRDRRQRIRKRDDEMKSAVTPNPKPKVAFDEDRAATYDQRAARIAPLRDTLHLLTRLQLSGLRAVRGFFASVSEGAGADLSLPRVSAVVIRRRRAGRRDAGHLSSESRGQRRRFALHLA